MIARFTNFNETSRDPGAARRMPVARAVLAAGLSLALAAVMPLAATAQGNPPDSFAPIVKAQMPAVVNIATTQQVQASQGRMPQFPEGSPLEDFFREFFGGQMPEGAAREVSALGSGFIVSEDGHVVTNAHVIKDATEIQVIMQDDRKLEAKVVGRDPATDLAVLKVDAARPLPHVEWGNPSETEIGDWVVAIGNPFGLGGSVTVGVLSARARDIQAGPYDDFLQTDAPINQGNSGGPLFNRRGQVIGVNTVILSPSGGNVGIGFAIPASTAKPIVEQLKERGHVERGWLGVRIQPVTKPVANAIGMESAEGALIAAVTGNSPAAEAGLKAGDVVVGYGGKEVESVRDLPRLVANTEIGSEVEIAVWRKGAVNRLDVRIGRRPDRPDVAEAEPESGPDAGEGALGLALSDLSPQARARLGLKPDVSGALVTGVRRGSPAAKHGVRPGDVIVQVGERTVSSAADAAEALRAEQREGDKPVLVRINREGDHLFIALA